MCHVRVSKAPPPPPGGQKHKKLALQLSRHDPQKSFLKFWVLTPLIDSTVAMAFVVSEHYGRSHQLFLNASALTIPNFMKGIDVR
ncbi:hypothetical protein SprV_0200919900 [Sparganum proliferum]